MKWGKEPIALFVNDAAKRVPVMSHVLTTLRDALQPGAIMVFQDFCHFPSYEIPAGLYRLRDHLEFVEAVVPGTTLVFRVKSQWNLAEVTQTALSLSRWTPDEISRAWTYWLDDGFVPEEKGALFLCGKAMFLCDLGHSDKAVGCLALNFRFDAETILPKWRYLKANRPDFLTRYAPLFTYLESQGAL
jgi:hypothetical protein